MKSLRRKKLTGLMTPKVLKGPRNVAPSNEIVLPAYVFGGVRTPIAEAKFLVLNVGGSSEG
jgi:hypothetical protein